MTTFRKDPEAVLDYHVDWSDWLGIDTIFSSSWSCDDSGITIDSDSATATVTTVWLSGGTVDEEYEVVNHIVTTAGREEDKTLTIRMRNN